jgi:hypothetical protein
MAYGNVKELPPYKKTEGAFKLKMDRYPLSFYKAKAYCILSIQRSEFSVQETPPSWLLLP